MSGTFSAVCKFKGVPVAKAEYVFAPPRRWRFDFCWPEHMIALEIEGGVWIRGRHTRGSGFVKDIEKYNEAAILGYRVLRCTRQQFDDGTVIYLLERIFGGNES